MEYFCVEVQSPQTLFFRASTNKSSRRKEKLHAKKGYSYYRSFRNAAVSWAATARLAQLRSRAAQVPRV